MSNDLNNMPPQFAAIRQRILDAEAKGLIVPEIQFDVPENETPAEAAARMERMAGFAMTPADPAKIRQILGLPERPTFDEFPPNEAIGTLYRCKLTGEVFRFEGEPADLFVRNEVRLRLERGADPVRDSECRDVGRYRFSLYYEPLSIASGEPVDEPQSESFGLRWIMKLFTAVCLSLAMVIGGSTAAYSCDGGHGGGVGCRVTPTVATFTVEDGIRWIRILGLLVP